MSDTPRSDASHSAKTTVPEPAKNFGSRLAMLTREGWDEIVDGLRSWRLSHLIGSAEMRRRYARSKLGQAWLVLSTAATIGALGWLWSVLWRVPLQEMLLYVGISFVLWQFVAGVLNECATAFVTNAHYFMNQHVSASTIVLSVVYRNALILLHNVPILIGLMLWLGVWPGWTLLWLVPAAVLVAMLSYWVGYLLAAICARYRDVGQVVNIAVQFGFFFTPILWRPEQAPTEAQALLMLNPLHHLLDILRAPMMGSTSSVWTWVGIAAASLGGCAASLPLIGWLRTRVVFWI